MTHTEARISNERLAEPDDNDFDLARALRKYNIGTVKRLDEVIAALRSTPVEAEGNQAKGQVQRVFALENAAGGNQPFAWHWSSRNAQFSFPVWVIGAARPDTAPANAIALYAHPLPNPSPSDGEVKYRDIIDYVLQDDLHNRLVPRIVDIAYSAFMNAHRPNKEDGGPTDWFTDTKPIVDDAIKEIRVALQSSKRGQP